MESGSGNALDTSRGGQRREKEGMCHFEPQEVRKEEKSEEKNPSLNRWKKKNSGFTFRG